MFDSDSDPHQPFTYPFNEQDTVPTDPPFQQGGDLSGIELGAPTLSAEEVQAQEALKSHTSFFVGVLGAVAVSAVYTLTKNSSPVAHQWVTEHVPGVIDWAMDISGSTCGYAMFAVVSGALALRDRARLAKLQAARHFRLPY